MKNKYLEFINLKFKNKWIKLKSLNTLSKLSNILKKIKCMNYLKVC